MVDFLWLDGGRHLHRNSAQPLRLEYLKKIMSIC